MLDACTCTTVYVVLGLRTVHIDVHVHASGVQNASGEIRSDTSIKIPNQIVEECTINK